MFTGSLITIEYTLIGSPFDASNVSPYLNVTLILLKNKYQLFHIIFDNRL